MELLSGSTTSNEQFGNTASERMLAHRAYFAASSAAEPQPSFPAETWAARPAKLAASEYQGAALNPVYAPPPVFLPPSVTWAILETPPPEEISALAMHVHQLAIATLDLHGRLEKLEARNKCGLGFFSALLKRR